MTSLVWFRNDLRIADHAPLRRAANDESMIALYCFDPRQFGKTSYGFDPTGRHRTKFLLQSVADLRQNLRRLGGELIIRRGRPEEIVGPLVQRHGVTRLHHHEPPGTEEAAIGAAVGEICQARGCAVSAEIGDTLYHLDDLPFEVADTPELYTRFRKQVEDECTIAAPLDRPARLPAPPPGLDPGELPTAQQLGQDAAEMHERSTTNLVGGESAAWDRIEAYFWSADRLRVYKETRNGMLELDDSSKFSAYLACGCLSPRSIAAEVSRYEAERVANQSTYWMIFELLWREYFRLIERKHGRRLYRPGGLLGKTIPWRNNDVLFEAWTQGKTGFPLVDANMRELAATGLMSNRGRQNVGSFLTKNLGIDWLRGAQWFESLLVDYDVASNYGNWAYVAGVGNDARGFRFFNILKQSHDYDADGSYVKHWLPELANVPTAHVHSPWTMSPGEARTAGVELGVNYPAPVVDLFESAAKNEAIYNEATGRGGGRRRGSRNATASRKRDRRGHKR